jgi:hypothetical protein
MTTIPTPPPVPPSGGAPADPGAPRPNRSAARVITILTAALGVGILVAVAWGGIRSTVAAAAVSSETHEVAVAGVDVVDVDISAASLIVRFDDVTEASLEVRNSSSGAWTFERSAETLRVETPRTPFLSWFGGSGNGRGVLTLPAELEGADADLSLGAGSIDADGAFGMLALDMGAGDVTLRGSADSFTADVSAGRADVELADVDEADVQLSAGDMHARLSGEAPSDVQLSVSAGSLELTLPDGQYAVTSEVSAGDFDNGLQTSSAASSRVSVEVAAGTVQLLAD